MYRFSQRPGRVLQNHNFEFGCFTHASSFLGFDGHVEGLWRCVWWLEG